MGEYLKTNTRFAARKEVQLEEYKKLKFFLRSVQIGADE